MGRHKSGKDKVGVDGDWFAMPCSFLASRACAELSPLACKMLLTLIGQLRSNHFGNGRIGAHFDHLRLYGWTSQESARAAMKELTDAGLIVRTLQGCKGRMSLYAVTLFQMHTDPKGLDVGPSAWRNTDWRRHPGSEAKPTKDRPAKWHRPRASKKQSQIPRGERALPELAPVTGDQDPKEHSCAPVAGVQTGVEPGKAHPRRVSPLREAICERNKAGRLGLILAQRTTGCAPKPAAYFEARLAIRYRQRAAH